MILPFTIEDAKMAIEAGTGVIETRNGNQVDIITWKNSEGYISGDFHSDLGVVYRFRWHSSGIPCGSFDEGYDLIIKPTISL